MSGIGELLIHGEMVEIGELDSGEHGFVLRLEDDRFISIIGLTEDECRPIDKLLYKNCELSFGGPLVLNEKF